MMKITNEMMIPMMVPSKTAIKRVIRDRNVPIAIIKEVVVGYFDITEQELDNKSRKAPVVHRRQVAHYLMEKYSNKTLSFIGQFTGGKDHSTVLHSKDVISNQLETNYKNTRVEIEDIQNMIYRKLIRIVDIYKDMSITPMNDIEVDRRKGSKEK